MMIPRTNVHVEEMKIGSLCSGYGGLELAVEQLTGGHTAWQSETDPHASTVLSHHWPSVPNHGDLTAVDWTQVEPVNVVTAGYPCQPFSTAGRRQGETDVRHLWPGVLRAVRLLRPRFVFLENVSGHLSLGFGRVLGDLAEAGYVGSWICLRASDVGAPHRRDRVFVVAADAGGEAGGRSGDAESTVGGGADEDPVELGRRDRFVADAERRVVGAQRDLGATAGQRTPLGPDVERCGVGLGRPFGAYQPAVDRWAHLLGRPAPPGLHDGRLNERFVEWMMGLPAGWVTDHVSRRHALRILGNGVVPQQALAAYRMVR